MTKNDNKRRYNGQPIKFIDHPDVVDSKDTADTIQTYNASANNVDVDKLVNTVYKNFTESDARKLMLQGIDYYEGKSDIEKKERFDHYGVKGKKNDRLNNTKYKKNAMRKLTRQKVNYALSKPFSITTDDKRYEEILESEYFEKGFYTLIKNLGKESIKEGINWLNVYYDEVGKLCYRRVPGNQVYAFWKDIEHTELEQLIHFYKIDVYEGDKVNNTEYADYYNGKGVVHYVKGEQGFERRFETHIEESEEGHFNLLIPQVKEIKNDKGEVVDTTYLLDAEGNIVFSPVPYVWDKLPWVPFKYNDDETSLLQYIKNGVDTYEKLFSTDIDIVLDIPDVIKIIKGYGGANLEDLIDKIYQYRAVLVDGDGGMTALETPFDFTSSNLMLERIRKDIYEDGSGADMQDDGTGDKSGVGLKYLYSDLDLDCDELINEFRASLEWLLFFIDFDIQLKHGTDYTETEVTFTFNTNFIINEGEQITNINNSRDMIPDQFLLPKHPFVEDVEEVEEAIEEQAKEEEKKQQDLLSQFGTGQPYVDANGNPAINPEVVPNSPQPAANK